MQWHFDTYPWTFHSFKPQLKTRQWENVTKHLIYKGLKSPFAKKKIKIFKSFLREWFNNKYIIIVTHLSYGVLVYIK